MNTLQLLESTMEQVVQRVGDPAPLVYERLFATAPELRELFANDPRGSVRGEMFHRVIEVLIDMAGEQRYATGLMAAEWITHRGLGITAAQFNGFFDAVVAVFRQTLGADWTADVDAAWRDTVARLTDSVAASEAAA
jgi:hemoglobin-like flavoprotein